MSDREIATLQRRLKRIFGPVQAICLCVPRNTCVNMISLMQLGPIGSSDDGTAITPGQRGA